LTGVYGEAERVLPGIGPIDIGGSLGQDPPEQASEQAIGVTDQTLIDRTALDPGILQGVRQLMQVSIRQRDPVGPKGVEDLVQAIPGVPLDQRSREPRIIGDRGEHDRVPGQVDAGGLNLRPLDREAEFEGGPELTEVSGDPGPESVTVNRFHV
jgi:hypothetical protein